MQLPSVLLRHNLYWFSQPGIMGTSLSSTVILGCRGTAVPLTPLWGTSVAEISLSIFDGHMQVWDQPVLCLCSSYQSQGNFFCMSLVFGLPIQEDFRQLSMMFVL